MNKYEDKEDLNTFIELLSESYIEKEEIISIVDEIYLTDSLINENDRINFINYAAKSGQHLKELNLIYTENLSQTILGTSVPNRIYSFLKDNQLI